MKNVYLINDLLYITRLKSYRGNCYQMLTFQCGPAGGNAGPAAVGAPLLRSINHQQATDVGVSAPDSNEANEVSAVERDRCRSRAVSGRLSIQRAEMRSFAEAGQREGNTMAASDDDKRRRHWDENTEPDDRHSDPLGDLLVCVAVERACPELDELHGLPARLLLHRARLADRVRPVDLSSRTGSRTRSTTNSAWAKSKGGASWHSYARQTGR